MQTILPPSGNTIKILGKARSAEHGLRWMHYVLAQPVEGGVLVFHTLTRALLLLTPEEYAAPDNLPELRDGWFRVPQEMDDMKYADQVRFIRRTMWKEPEHITSYTIFTTTDCNARCFYCYEMGRSRIPMSAETAHKAAAYIAAHCGGEKVHLHWFGGEPLFNKQVIDIICTDLTEKGIVYESMMISNGYLFDGATVEQAVSHWKLKSVQITLDGTEEIYNRSKAFIYKDGQSPYQVVLANIQRLLDAGVSVHIRLNMDEHNADNLMELADELHERFGGKGKFSVYSHTLFEFAGSKTHIRAQEERRQLYQKQQRLRKKLDDCGIGASYYLRQKLRIRQCMADSGGSLTILPNGELGLCEHYSEDNFVGSLDGFFKQPVYYADYISQVVTAHTMMLASFSFSTIQSGTLQISDVERFMTLADDRKAANELRYVDLNSAFQAVADQNTTQQERQESYEKYEAEQEKRIQELEEKISAIYSRWDEY